LSHLCLSELVKVTLILDSDVAYGLSSMLGLVAVFETCGLRDNNVPR